MSRHLAGRRVPERIATSVVAAALFLPGAIAVLAQGTARDGKVQATRSYPKLPGAVSKPPDWIGKGAPFDMAKFFAAPPLDRNAAPLYLDALFEFSGELAGCFPDGPETERRRQAAKDRNQRHAALENALYKDPTSVSSQAIDDVIAPYDLGFRKLIQAQRRERCVFETGIGIVTAFPHAQATRQVARITSLRVRRAVERGDIDGAVREVEMLLRLCHDLKPRGGLISQLIATAVLQFVGVSVVPPILASPDLRAAHCDRLLKALVALEADGGDGYLEGLKAEYLTTRVTLRDLVRHQPQLAKSLGLKPGESVFKAVFGQAPVPPGISLPANADVQLAGTLPDELARQEARVDAYYCALLRLDRVPYAPRLEQIAALKMSGGDDLLSRLVAMIQPASQPYAQALARATATVHAMECLVALRRWQLSHKGMPRDLATVIKGTVLKGVPIDPYDGKPLRPALLDGQPIVYSVGKDGTDEGGQSDSKLDMRPGDLIYRLPPQGARP